MAQESGGAGAYLGQELARLDVGPVRACYLVPDRDHDRLAEAITAASRRWGGVTEPILPVGPDGMAGEQWPRIMEALAPDVYVGVAWMTGLMPPPSASWARACSPGRTSPAISRATRGCGATRS